MLLIALCSLFADSELIFAAGTQQLLCTRGALQCGERAEAISAQA